MLDLLLHRLQSVPSIDEIVLATTLEVQDDRLANWAESRSISCFRGSTIDVMGRVIGAGTMVCADIIVEITGDCPLIDPLIVELALATYMANDVDYVSNSIVRSFPDGMDVQVFSRKILEESYAMTSDPLDLEHVTRHIQRTPEKFSRINIIAPLDQRWPELGLTLDERSDFDLISAIISSFPEDKLFGCSEILQLMRSDPRLHELNAHVQRKGSD